MSIDIEQRVRDGLAEAPSPAGLALDAGAVTRVASRAHRRRRGGQALLGGMTSLAVLAGATWAGGWLPADVQRALPASPWAGCPLTWNGTGNDVHLDAVEHAVLPLPDGGAVVAGVARGCPDYDALFFTASTLAPEALPVSLPMLGGLEDRPVEDHDTSWFQGLRLEDGREVTAMMVPRGSTGVAIVGPDAVHEPADAPVRVPGTGLDALVVEDYWPAGEDLGHVRRGADGLVHTSWSNVIGRVWQGDDPSAELTDTWVGQDRQEQQWVMRLGEVRGPFPVSTTPYAVVFPAPGAAPADLVVVLPDAGGQLSLVQGGQEVDGETLRDQDGNTRFSAVLLTVEDLSADGSPRGLEWSPARGGKPQPVEVVEP